MLRGAKVAMRCGSCQAFQANFLTFFDNAEYPSDEGSHESIPRGDEMVGVVAVSHSPEIARGVVEMAAQMAGVAVGAVCAGGDWLGRAGTDGAPVREAIGRGDQGGGVVVLAGLGSAVLTSERSLETGYGAVRLAVARVVEGAVAAAVVGARR